MNASPSLLRRIAPSPRRASERRKRGAPFDVQGGGMELDELDVIDFGAGAPCHGDAVAGGDIGIGGLLEDAPEAAGGEQHGAGADVAQGAGFLVEDHRARRPRSRVIGRQKVCNSRVTFKTNVGKRGGFAVQRAGDFAAGGIAVGVQDAVAAVRAFAGEGEFRSCLRGRIRRPSR